VYDDFGGAVMSDEEGQRLAGALGGPGKEKTLILRNHGLMSVGERWTKPRFCLLGWNKRVRSSLRSRRRWRQGI
jgi:hypothetical protein